MRKKKDGLSQKEIYEKYDEELANQIDLTTLPLIPVIQEKIAGIYFLYNKKKLIYIGASSDVLRRVIQHKKDKVFTGFKFTKVRLANLFSIERALIKKYKPELNLQVKRNE